MAEEGQPQVGSEAMPLVQTGVRLPEELKAAAEQEAALQGVSFSEFIRQSISVRLTWMTAIRAIQEGLDVEDAQDVDTISKRLASAMAHKHA